MTRFAWLTIICTILKTSKIPRSVTFSKVANLLKVILLHGWFLRFLNCANGTKSRQPHLVCLHLTELHVRNILRMQPGDNLAIATHLLSHNLQKDKRNASQNASVFLRSKFIPNRAMYQIFFWVLRSLSRLGLNSSSCPKHVLRDYGSFRIL